MNIIAEHLELISVLLFFALIALRLYIKRKELKIEKVIIFEYSKKYTDKINEVVSKYPKFFKVLGIISLVSAPIMMFVGIYYIINSLIFFKPSVALVLPSVSNFKYPGPVISVPFWIWIIAIFVIVFSHESMHALIAASEGIKTRRYGLLYLLVIPIGAFVDIDEKRIEKLETKKKIKIFAAGSLGNVLAFLLFLIILIVFSQIINQLLESKGVWFNNTASDSPAEKVGLKGIIVKIDNTTINNIYDLRDFLSKVKPNTTVLIETTEGKYELTLAEKDNKSYIGIVGVKNYIVYKGTNKPVSENIITIINYSFAIIQWVAFLSLGVAIANMLPIIPLDGGLIIKEILKKKLGKKGEELSNLISSIFLILLLSSLFLSSLTLRVAS
jgi:membrane-associated protease RseP (regulator of RpoE activity)